MAEGNDGSFDHCICACVQAMRRFMEMIRNSQNICHDTGCLDEYPSLQPSSANSTAEYMLTIFLVLALWLLVALLLFIYRPSSLRKSAEQKRHQKPSFDPPGAPPTAN